MRTQKEQFPRKSEQCRALACPVFCNSISVPSFIWPRPYVLMSYPPSLFWKWPHRLVSVSLCKASLKLRPGREEPWDASGLGHEAAGAVIWPNKLFKPLLRALTQSSKRGMITFQKNPKKFPALL